MDEIIKTFIERHSIISQMLEDRGDLSLKILIDDDFKKALVLGIASSFEQHIQESIRLLVTNSTNSELIQSLIESKVISRQYHSYFDWKGNNVNNFLGMFGEQFRKKTLNDFKNNPQLNLGSQKFIEIGRQRNILIHENFLTISLDWTFDEIIGAYQSVYQFVLYIRNKFSELNQEEFEEKPL